MGRVGRAWEGRGGIRGGRGGGRREEGSDKGREGEDKGSAARLLPRGNTTIWFDHLLNRSPRGIVDCMGY